MKREKYHNKLNNVKTKFILYGGFNPNNQTDNNDSFYREILNDSKKEPSILIVPFAKSADRIPATSEIVIKEFNKNNLEKNLHFQIADEGSFTKQVKASDIIYFQGGSTLKLIEVLKKFPNLSEVLKGKIVA